MSTHLLDPLLYYHSSEGILFNQSINCCNLLFNLIVIVGIILILTCFLLWRKQQRHPVSGSKPTVKNLEFK